MQEIRDGQQSNMKTIYLNNQLINVGDWDYKRGTNINGEEVIENPLPEGIVEKDEEVVTNPDGSRSVVN